jgi:hypothetical protein
MCVIAVLEVWEDSMLQRLSGDSETTLCDLNSNWLIYSVNLIDGPHSFWIGMKPAASSLFMSSSSNLKRWPHAQSGKKNPASLLGSKGFLQYSNVNVFCVQAIFIQQHRREGKQRFLQQFLL